MLSHSGPQIYTKKINDDYFFLFLHKILHLFPAAVDAIIIP